MKVLFLDIDGVLNCQTTPGSMYRKLDKFMVARLDRVLDATNAKVVLSSTWRLAGVESVQQILRDHGMRNWARVIDRTPRDLGDVIRGREIGEWLTKHPDVKTFAIVDDDRDMGSLLPFLVQTNWVVGMTDKDADKLIRMLR